MKLKIITEKISARGVKKTTEKDFDQRRILFGRDVAADIVINSRSVSLHHASFYEQNSKIVAEDLDSLSGLKVNGRLVKRAILKNLDEIEIGGARLLVESDQPEFQIRYFPPTRETFSVEEKLQRDLSRLDFNSFYKKLSLSLTLILVVSFFLITAIPVFTDSKQQWSSGPIHFSHQFIEDQCELCHTADFSSVPDSKCTSCHAMSAHIHGGFATGTIEPTCVSCHQDHQGVQGLKVHQQSDCSNCHASQNQMLAFLGDASVLPEFETLKQHPQFRVFVGSGENRHLVSLDNKEELVDPGRLKFNHKVHLEEGLHSPSGYTDLLCLDCHSFKKDGNNFSKISFDEHCHACHSLEFDKDFADLEVPHESADQVFAYLMELYWMHRHEPQTIDPRARAQRRLPGRSEVNPEMLLDKRSALQKARDIEQWLFEKGPCHYCHQVEKLELAPEDSVSSAYYVVAPNITYGWSKTQSFKHRPHQMVTCISCHTTALNSETEKNVLLAKVETCYSCHAKDEGLKIENECTQCHSYHYSISLGKDEQLELRKKMELYLK